MDETRTDEVSPPELERRRGGGSFTRITQRAFKSSTSCSFINRQHRSSLKHPKTFSCTFSYGDQRIDWMVLFHFVVLKQLKTTSYASVWHISLYSRAATAPPQAHSTFFWRVLSLCSTETTKDKNQIKTYKNSSGSLRHVMMLQTLL